jgi:hypothetical protein
MADDRRGALFNVLTVVVLVATACLLVLYGAIGFKVIDPFPRPTPGEPVSPRATPVPPTATVPTAIPTWTPTATPTITPTPGPTKTRTPTPRVTRSPDWPFTCEVDLRRPEYDSWSGVAGYVQDLDGNPLPGFNIKVECPGVGRLDTRAGVNPTYNRMYGSEAAWEQVCNPIAYQAMEIRVQMWSDQPNPSGEYEAVSDLRLVRLEGRSSASLGFVVCTLNWEDFYGTPTPTPTPEG